MSMHNLQVDVEAEAKALVTTGMIAKALAMFAEREKDLVEEFMPRTGLDYVGTAEMIKASIVNDAFGFIWRIESKKIVAAMQHEQMPQEEPKTPAKAIEATAEDFALGAAFCRMEPGCESCQ